ncbi:MAG: hypothetical protein E7425_05715 [Ruminococcaceae bacterium]|nr:hypothetical protein [Oscillospiraceae bacterium]
MKAFHTFWTAPNRARHAGQVVVPDYELLTMMLSALKWREHSGAIRMVTDCAGAAFLERAGLAGLWSEPIDVSLDGLERAVDPVLFWAAGKLEALRRTPSPCVMLDADMILWEDVSPLLTDCAVAAHREDLLPDVYPDPAAAFVTDGGYALPPDWDLTLRAANTAFLYLPCEALRLRYTDEAFRFMHALRASRVGCVATMCFAEQRLLPMCADACGVPLKTLLPDGELDKQSFITHLWGHKRTLERSAERRVEYCLGCTLRIVTDHPEYEGVLAANEQTRVYLDSL